MKMVFEFPDSCEALELPDSQEIKTENTGIALDDYLTL